MTQADLDWLVRPPEGTSFSAALTTACRGSSTIATVLNFFLFEAAKLVKRSGLNKEMVDCIPVVCTHDEIIAGIKRLNRTASKKTLIAYISKLQSWEFVQSDGYHHTYDVYFNNIQAAFTNPPTPEAPKLRGRHANRTPKTTEDCSFNCEVESTISTILPEIDGDRIVILSDEIVNLQSEIVDLRAEIVKVQSEIVKVQSLQSSETASRLTLEAKVEALYNLIYNGNKDIYKKEETEIANSPLLSDSDESVPPSQEKNNESESVTTPPADNQPEPTKQEEIPFEKLPWNAKKALMVSEQIVGKKYRSGEKELKACAKILKSYQPTQEIYIRVFSKIYPWYRDKGKLLHPTDLAANSPRGRVRFEELLEEIEYQDERNGKGKRSGTNPLQQMLNGQMSHDEAVKLASVVVAQAKEHGMNIQARATSTSSDAWVVSASWDGDKLQPITSPALWTKYFAELRLVAEDYAAEQKGAR